jgi:dephospho-CoA kinase
MQESRHQLAARSSFENLLLVTGVSGSGKTTFIDTLHGGKLAPDILALLHPETQKWREMFGRNRRLSRREIVDDTGVVLHHEITRPFRTRTVQGGEDEPRSHYAIDETPWLGPALRNARNIYVVIVRPSASVLIQQLGRRNAVVHCPRRIRSRAERHASIVRSIEESIPDWVKNNRLISPKWALRELQREINTRLCEFYGRPHFLDSLYSNWEATIREFCGDRINASSILQVEPVSSFGEKAFRIAHCTTSS